MGLWGPWQPVSQWALWAFLLAALFCGRAAPCSLCVSVLASFLLGSRATRELQGQFIARLRSTHDLLCDLLPSHVVQDLLDEEESSSECAQQPQGLSWFQAPSAPQLIRRGQSWLREAVVRTPSSSSCPLPGASGCLGAAPPGSHHGACGRADCSSCTSTVSYLEPSTPPAGLVAAISARWQRRATDDLLPGSPGSPSHPHSPTAHGGGGQFARTSGGQPVHPLQRSSMSPSHLTFAAQLALTAAAAVGPFDLSRGLSLDAAAPPSNSSSPLPSPLRSVASAGAAMITAYWNPAAPAGGNGGGGGNGGAGAMPCDVPSRLRRRSACCDEPNSAPSSLGRQTSMGAGMMGPLASSLRPPQRPPMRRSSTMGVLNPPVPPSQHETPFAEAHECVTILFADVVGFTHFAQQVTCMKVLATLNDLYSRFDALCSTMPVYKIQIIGDAYMCATGLMHDDPDHAETMMRFAQAMLLECEEVLMPHTGEAVQIRVGISSGSVMSGLVGRIRRQFSVFGETVNTASRMEATSHAGGIHISQSTHALVSHLPHWSWASQCSEVKSMGRITTYMLHPEPPFNASAYVSTRSSVIAAAAAGGGTASRSSFASTRSPHSTRSLPLPLPATPRHSAFQEPLVSCESWDADAVRAALLHDSTAGLVAFSSATSSNDAAQPAAAAAQPTAAAAQPAPPRQQRLPPRLPPPVSTGPAPVVPRQHSQGASAAAAAVAASSSASLQVHIWCVHHDKVFLRPCELSKSVTPSPHRHAVAEQGMLAGQGLVVAAAAAPPSLPESCRCSPAGPPHLWRQVSLGCGGAAGDPSLNG